MLHELLLSILGCSTSLEKILENDPKTLFDKYFHPGEKGIIKKVLSIGNDYNFIKKFIKTYSSINNNYENANDTNNIRLKQGLYLQALCDGMDQSLDEFIEELILLEKSIIYNINLPATALLSIIENYQYLFNIIIRIICKVKTQSIHGCALLQCIHELKNTGIVEENAAMKKMLRCGHAIFYKQLTSWLLYGHLEDIHEEFFIQKIKTTADEQNLFREHLNNSVTNDKLNDMWNYDIIINMLPSYITVSLATKILTIGQTIIIFGNDPRRQADFSSVEKPENPVWGKREHEYFRKLQNLQMKATFNVVELENTINELKHCVTKLLWHVAVNNAHLLQQLKLIKDFYLIGRGDLFLDFIKLTSHILNKTPLNHTSRDINLAFQMTMRRLLSSDENAVDNFNFLVPVLDNDFSESILNSKKNFEYAQKDRQDPIDKQGWGLIVLQYRVVWPLQLLFSPKILNDYNNIFRFLLRVKKTQFNLWNLWSDHTRSKNIDISVLQLRNHLIFILDNLQYYLQVDVLESQYTIMENRVKSTENFEEVQIAHSTFLANIMSQTFLTSNTNGKYKNPINNLIRLLLRLCDDFILHVSIWEVTHLLSTEKEELKTLTDTLSSVMDLLIKTLNRVRTQPSGMHLGQLLLRLDFNRWFSKQI